MLLPDDGGGLLDTVNKWSARGTRNVALII